MIYQSETCIKLPKVARRPGPNVIMFHLLKKTAQYVEIAKTLLDQLDEPTRLLVDILFLHDDMV